MVGPIRPQIVLFGSSIVQFSYSHNGWGAALSDTYSRQADILLRGYAGWNSRRALQVLDQVFPKDADVQPSLVIVYFGGNDSVRPHPTGLGPHVPLSEYTENIRKIAFHLKSLSETTCVIFLGTPPVNEAQIRDALSDKFDDMGRTNELCRIYSEACLKCCSDLDVKVIDLWTAFQKRDDWLTACFTDGIHLSSEGSKMVVKEILKILDWEPHLHCNSLPVEFSEESTYDNVGFNGPSIDVHSTCCFSPNLSSTARERNRKKKIVGPVRPQFVLFGSSIVQFSYNNDGWGAILADIYARKVDIFLRGYVGWNSRHALQVLHQVFPKDAAVQPSLVIVYFGGNDSMRPHPSGLGPHVPLPEYIENMRKIAIYLKSLSQTTRLIFLGAPPVNEAQIRDILG